MHRKETVRSLRDKCEALHIDLPSTYVRKEILQQLLNQAELAVKEESDDEVQ